MRFTIILIILIIFTGFVMANKQQYYSSTGEQLVNSLVVKAAKIIKDKYNINPAVWALQCLEALYRS